MCACVSSSAPSSFDEQDAHLDCASTYGVLTVWLSFIFNPNQIALATVCSWSTLFTSSRLHVFTYDPDNDDANKRLLFAAAATAATAAIEVPLWISTDILTTTSICYFCLTKRIKIISLPLGCFCDTSFHHRNTRSIQFYTSNEAAWKSIAHTFQFCLPNGDTFTTKWNW